MPQRSKSGLVDKLGGAGRTAFDGHKGDNTTYSSAGDLPPGIEGGVAQLVDCKFDTYKKGVNKGEYYFLAAGIVKEPKEHDGRHTDGLRTQIMEPMCDTPRKRSRTGIDDHVEWVLNEIRKLGVDTKEIDFDDLEDVVAAIKEDQPHFRFRTWQGSPSEEFPNPRVNHEWRGICDYNGEIDDGVIDETGQDTIRKNPEPELVGGQSELHTLGAKADNGDREAALVLADRAEAMGLDPEQYDTWANTASAIAKVEEGSSGEEEKKDAWRPKKEEVYDYKPPERRRAVQCEVTAVFTGKQTCNLKNLDDGTLYKGVGWDFLAEA